MFAGSGTESGACAAVDPAGTKHPWAGEVVVVVTVVVVEATVVPGTDDVTGSVDDDGALDVDDDFPPLLPHAASNTTAETANHP
jgi:hypothetical protein